MNRNLAGSRLLVMFATVLCLCRISFGGDVAVLSSKLTDVKFDPDSSRLTFSVTLTNDGAIEETLFNPFNRPLIPKPLRADLCDEDGRVVANWDWERTEYAGSRRGIDELDWVVLPPGDSVTLTESRVAKYAKLKVTKDELTRIETLFLRVSFANAIRSPVKSIRPADTAGLETFHAFWERFDGPGTTAVSSLVELPKAVVGALKSARP